MVRTLGTSSGSANGQMITGDASKPALATSSPEEGFLGAVASNAGDDFHTLWAAREILRLLDLQGDVSAVKVEGLPRDEIHASLGLHGQAVDILLLRNTTPGPFHSYLQLKYSASNPADSWTWARLLAPRAKTRPQSSVLGKLAGLMKAVGFKGDFAIVSNQPLEAKVATDVDRLVASGVVPAAADQKLFDQLLAGLGLTSAELIAFLKVWDRTTFHSASRLALESEVIRRVAQTADADARDDAGRLQRRVAALMLPENQNHPPVTREDLLLWLGAGSQQMLFPAPSRIQAAQPYLRRAVVKDLAQLLAANRSRPLRIHAGGGCGKTSLVCDLPAILPSGSEVLIYDCYGGGLFLASDQKRHHPEQAFTQLGNELAARLKSPLVVRRVGSVDPFEAFRNRVDVAAELLKLRNADAQLILCFDAVDNARTGARHWQEPCFLDALSQASNWPDNVKVVVTCRTARRAEVGDSALYEDFEVLGFDTEEVRKLVALWQPTWPSQVAATLKDLSGGNPRRLVYAVEGLPADGALRAIERLMPKAEGINPLFKQRVHEAGKHLGDEAKVWHVLDALARLPRPVPGGILVRLAGVREPDIADIEVDVGGIVRRDEGWSFQDEDFEAFVVERPECNGPAVLDQAADLLFTIRLTDRYAAMSVAEVLAAAGRLDDLYALVTQAQEPSAVLGRLEAQFVQARRLSLAIRCCRMTSDMANACRLLIAAADAVRRSEMLVELTLDHLDLSVRFARDEAYRLAMVGQRHRSKRARLRIELARVAVPSNLDAAAYNLRWWGAHLRELRDQLREDKRDARSPEKPSYEVGASDVASEYEVMRAIRGDDAAFDQLFRWSPSALEPTFRLLAQRAAGHQRQPLLDAIARRRWPPGHLAALLAAALLAGADFSDPLMRAGLERLALAKSARWPKVLGRGLQRTPVLAWSESVLLVCECAVTDVGLRDRVAQILDRAMPKPQLTEAFHLERLRSEGAQHARAYALRERLDGVTAPVDQWLPGPRAEPSQPARRADRGLGPRERSPEAEWNQVLGETGAAFSRCVAFARATLAARSGDPVASLASLADVAKTTHAQQQTPNRDGDAIAMLVRNHLLHVGLSGGDVASLVKPARALLNQSSRGGFDQAQDLALSLALLPAAHDAALTLLNDLTGEIKSHPLAASQRAKLHAESARIALPLDPGLAEALFGEAVEATVGVDFEARGALSAAGAIGRAGLGPSVDLNALAARLADAIGADAATISLGGDYPWAEALKWVARTSLPMGLVAASRWHDQGLLPFNRGLPAIWGERSNLSRVQRMALATLASDGPIDLEAMLEDEAKLPGWMVEAILEASLREGDMDAFVQTLDLVEGRADDDSLATMARAARYRAAFQTWRTEREPLQPPDAADLQDRHPGGNPPLRTVDEVRAALAVKPDKRRVDQHDIVEASQQLGSLALRGPFLETAFSICGNSGELGKAMPDILKGWAPSTYPPVTRWLRERFPAYIVGAVRDLFDWRYEDTESLEAALQATGLDATGQAGVLLDAIERHNEKMSADLLYALTGLVAARVPVARRAELFEVLVQRVEERTSHPPQVPLAGVDAPHDINESVARCLFAALGDMDRRVGWRASHAAMALFRGKDPAWKRLVECLQVGLEPVFAGAPSYRYGATEQLFVVLQRAAAERVQDLACHADLILQVIRREPHLIVRELGRAVLLAIDGAGMWPFTDEERRFLRQLNRSQLPEMSALPRAIRRLRSARRQERMYWFDDTDAVPYWYAPAAHLFGMDIDLFLDKLESWIYGRWGYGNSDSNWQSEPRLERVQHSHELTSRRQGTRPTLERLSYHIEWHAMMCVMGELIVEHPLAASPDGNAFEGWMKNHLPTLQPYWLSDLRSAPPLEPRFWGVKPADPSRQNDNGKPNSAGLEARALRLSFDAFDIEIDAAEGLVVAGELELRWHGVHRRVRIESALVSPITAHALAQALANARNHMDFALPEGRYHDNIEFPGFQLEAWLQTLERDPKGDQFDERRGAAAGIPVAPVGPAWGEGLTFNSGDGSWRFSDGDVAIESTQWGRSQDNQRDGWRATAKRSTVTDLLTRVQRSLLLYVEIQSKAGGENRGRGHDLTEWVFYVFDVAGSLSRITRQRRSLGRVLVRQEGLHTSVDTLGRWMLHRIAELESIPVAAGAPLSDIAPRSEVQKLCDAFRQRQ